MGGLYTGLKVLEGEFDTLVTLCDLGLVKVVQRESLGQLEYVLGLVVATQRLTDCFGGGFAPHIAMLGEDISIALAGHDGPDDLHAGDTCDVLNDVMQLYVHLHQCLLHVLDVGRRVFQQALALPQIGP